MSEKTREVPQPVDATYAHTLVIESTHEYKIHEPYGSNFARLTSHLQVTYTPMQPFEPRGGALMR